MNIGDTVEFSGEWCKNTGQLTGDIPFMQGPIVDLQPLSGEKEVATVDFNWLNAHGPDAHISPPQRMKALTSNLHLVKKGTGTPPAPPTPPTPPSKVSKLKTLAASEGYEGTLEFLEAFAMDCVVPGICTNEGCDYTTSNEPDCGEGWCEMCHTSTVRSGLLLAGII